MKIGIIGAGQLGRMLALAGYPLGLRFVFLDQSPNAPGAQVGQIVPGAFDDPAQLRALAQQADLITFDVENVPVEAVQPIAEMKPFYPPVKALGASQDRLHEKSLFRSLKIQTAPFTPVDSLSDLVHAADRIGIPGVLKTRRLGYDGRGQSYVRSPADIEPAWQALGSVPLIYEGFIDFSREVSLIGVRSTTGETAFYPLSANTHAGGILRYSAAPYRNTKLQQQAQKHMKRVMKALAGQPGYIPPPPNADGEGNLILVARDLSPADTASRRLEMSAPSSAAFSIARYAVGAVKQMVAL